MSERPARRSRLLVALLALAALETRETRAEPVQVHRRFGDRFYVADVLTRVFGPGAEAAAIIDASVLSQIDVFGGPCTLLEEVAVHDETRNGPRYLPAAHACRAGLGETKAPAFGRSDLMRLALTRQACGKLVANPELVARAFGGTFPWLRASDRFAAVARKFYPRMKSPEIFVARYLSGTGETERGLDSKFVYQLCASEAWQVP